MYPIFKICFTVEYFNFTLFNMVTKHYYILNTVSQKHTKFTFLPSGKRVSLCPQDSLALISKLKFSTRFSQKYGPAVVERDVLI